MVSIDLSGKYGLIVGVANHRSIAWAIAQALGQAGARLAFTYQGERLEKNVKELAATLPNSPTYSLDVTDDAQIDAVFGALQRDFGRLDYLVHSVAFARREDLEGQYLGTTRSGYALAQDVSAYSLVALAQRAAPLMTEGGSIITMTYLGSQRVIPQYNVMGVAKAALEASVRYLAADLGPKGIRVNAISAGPIKTLAARGIPGFSSVLDHVASAAPLRRGTDPMEVGYTALFLCSDLGRGITGNVIYVDSGYQIMGMTPPGGAGG